MPEAKGLGGVLSLTKRVLVTESLVIAAIGAVVVVLGWRAAVAFVGGGLAALLPTMVQAWTLQRPARETSLASVLLGAVGKLTLAGLLLTGVMLELPASSAVALSGFGTAVVLHPVVLAWLGRSTVRSANEGEVLVKHGGK